MVAGRLIRCWCCKRARPLSRCLTSQKTVRACMVATSLGSLIRAGWLCGWLLRRDCGGESSFSDAGHRCRHRDCAGWPGEPLRAVLAGQAGPGRRLHVGLRVSLFLARPSVLVRPASHLCWPDLVCVAGITRSVRSATRRTFRKSSWVKQASFLIRVMTCVVVPAYVQIPFCGTRSCPA